MHKASLLAALYRFFDGTQKEKSHDSLHIMF